MFHEVSDESWALHIEAAGQIRDAVRSGRLRAGSRLPGEHDLAAAFKVNRTVVRAALGLLCGEGVLVAGEDEGGFLVCPDADIRDLRPAGDVAIRPGVLRELFEMRRILEGQAAALAARRADASGVAAMWAVVGDYERGLQAGTLTSEDAFHLDLRLHGLVLQATGNGVLVRTMASVESLLLRSRRRTMALPGRMRGFVPEMDGLVAAIAAGDADRARRLMLRHLDTGWRALLHAQAISVRPRLRPGGRGRGA